MKSNDIHLKLFATLITLCTTAILAAQPGATTDPEKQRTSVAHPDLKAFPPAKAGMERFVIVLPRKERGEEDALRVELIPGKMMETDGVNLYRFGHILKEKNLEGFGYPFYEISEGSVAMTLIRPGPKPVIKFVSGQSLHTHYNSRLPIVIYAPAGYQIRYRIWKADETFSTAPKG
jgi:ecotin